MSLLQSNSFCIGVVIALCILAIIFIMYGHEHREEVQQALKQDFVKLPGTTVDWWSISHILLYMIIGFFIPDRHLTFFLIGCGFEILEDMLSGDQSTQLADCTVPNAKQHLMCMFSINDDYWYAKWDDIFMNLAGYVIGSAVRTSYFT
jgi:hypothetical protein